MPNNLVSNYTQSHAILIGIDEYLEVSPLKCAVNDAEGLAKTLSERFNFAEEDIHILKNEEGTKQNILEAYLRFARGGSGVNDRIVFFFAGHGHTEQSVRGEVGYLVPYDGVQDNLASLIRWDEITRNAHLIDAKHILYLMDACYGGLAVTRIGAGATRFLRNMLVRRARQVLTAGKADEPVVDQGGPLAGHSIFTGHLIEGLSGKAIHSGGILTANGLMAYVYEKVSIDEDSQQTPHYGYVEGDGDMIFEPADIIQYEGGGESEEAGDEDILVAVPGSHIDEEDAGQMSEIDQIKELIVEEKHRIKLRERVAGQIRGVISSTTVDQFPTELGWSTEIFIKRIEEYEEICRDLCLTQAILGYWGESVHREILTLAPRNLSGRFELASGNAGYLALRWYPAFLILYSGGIASVAAEKYENLAQILMVPVPDIEKRGHTLSFCLATCTSMSEVLKQFKYISGNERHYAPHSEYLFKALQPMIDDLLFLGSSYEMFFDKFEVLLGLIHSDEYGKIMDGISDWGPIGRYGWKYKRGDGKSPFHQLIMEAEQQGDHWPPLAVGLFGGSMERFIEVYKKFEEKLQRLGWY